MKKVLPILLIAGLFLLFTCSQNSEKQVEKKLSAVTETKPEIAETDDCDGNHEDCENHEASQTVKDECCGEHEDHHSHAEKEECCGEHEDHHDHGEKEDCCGEHAHHDVQWGTDIDAALKTAKNNDKILMIDFMADWCPPCRKMEKETFSDHDVIKKIGNFIPVRIDVDDNQDIANEYNGNAGKYGGIGIPNILFLDKDKNVNHHIVGFHDSKQLIAVMDSVLTGKYE